MSRALIGAFVYKSCALSASDQSCRIGASRLGGVVLLALMSEERCARKILFCMQQTDSHKSSLTILVRLLGGLFQHLQIPLLADILLCNDAACSHH